MATSLIIKEIIFQTTYQHEKYIHNNNFSCNFTMVLQKKVWLHERPFFFNTKAKNGLAFVLESKNRLNLSLYQIYKPFSVYLCTFILIISKC